MSKDLTRSTSSLRRDTVPFSLLVLLAMLLRPFHAIADPQPFDVSWSYYRHAVAQDGGSIHIGLFNPSDREQAIQSVSVDGQELRRPFDDRMERAERWREPDGSSVPAHLGGGTPMWHSIDRNPIPARSMAELIVKFFKPPQQPVQINIKSADSEELSINIAPVVGPLRISSVTFDRDLRTAYVYCANQSPEEFHLARLWFNGQDKTDSAFIIGGSVAPQSVGCMSLKLDQALKPGQRVYFKAETTEGFSSGCSLRAFSQFVVAEDWKGIVAGPAKQARDELDAWKQFTDNPYYKLDVVGHEIIDNRANPQYLKADQLMFYWSDQAFIGTGTWAFGELVDGARLHLQPSAVEYLGRYNERDFHYVQAKMRFIRNALAPNPVFAQTEVGHSFMDLNYQSLLSSEELRLRVYYLISRGAKGVLYRCGGSELMSKCSAAERAALERELEKLSDELLPMERFLRIGEFVDGMAKTSEPLVEAASLLCGKSGLALILLNHDRQQSWPRNEMYLKDTFFVNPVLDPFVVTVRVPEPLQPKHVIEIEGSSKWEVPFEFEAGILTFTVPSITTSRQYIVMSQHEPIPDEWGMLMPQAMPLVTASDGPDIQVTAKQLSWGSVPPSDQPIMLQSTICNHGTGLLEFQPVDKQAQSEIALGKTTLLPGEETNICFTFVPLPSQMHKVYRLRTNDPNEGEIRFDIGGRVERPFDIMPPQLRFAQVGLGRPVQGKFAVVENAAHGLQIVDISTSAPWIEVSEDRRESKPSTPESDVYASEKPLWAYHFTVTLDPEQADVPSEQWIRLTTNSNWEKEIVIPLYVGE